MQLVCCFIIGVGGNFSQVSYYAIINFLSAKIVSQFTVGTALSMVLVSIIRIIILAIMGPSSGNVNAIIIFFAVAIFGNMIALFLNFKFFRSDDYLAKVKPYEFAEEKELEEEEKGTKPGYFTLLYQASK